MDHVEQFSSLPPPRQARSQRTLERSLTAARELFAEQGVESTSVADIVARADSSVGSFYARFPCKDDLVRHLEVGLWTEALERWQQGLASRRWEELTVQHLVEGLVHLLVRTYGAEAVQREALGVHSRSQGWEQGDRDRFHQTVLEALRAHLGERRDEMDHPDPDVAIELGYRAVVGGIREVMEQAGEGEEPDEQLLGTELARCYLAYLLGEGLGDRLEKEGEVDFFDTWG